MANPDWIYWGNLETVSLTTAILLSLGIDPTGLDEDEIEQIPSAATRLRIAKNHLRKSLPRHHPHGKDGNLVVGDHVKLTEFRAWGQSLPDPFFFPTEFPGTPPAREEPSSAEISKLARMALWSESELIQLCAGLFPGTPNRTNMEQRAINEAKEWIARSTLARDLPYVSRDDAHVGDRLYGTSRHYVPSLAAEWAASNFPDSFPAPLLAAVRKRAAIQSDGPVVTTGEAPLRSDTRTNLLRVIRALYEKANFPEREAVGTVTQMIESLGFNGPKDDTVRNILDAARNLQPDRQPK